MKTLGSTMPTPIDIDDAKARFAELVERVTGGEEIVIAKAGRPVARLGPVVAGPQRRAPGRWANRVSISADFDAPLTDAALSAFQRDDIS